MTNYPDLTHGLQAILLHHLRGYTHSVAFDVDDDKLAAKGAALAVDYGTRLPGWQRQDRKQAGQPTAVAAALHTFATPPGKRTIVLMATSLVEQAHPASPWARQKWNAGPVELGSYALAYERRDRGDSGWTWRLNDQVFNGISRYIHTLVTQGDADAIRRETALWPKVYSMFGGVRRQLRKLLRSNQRLWSQLHSSTWPGLQESQLPQLGSWRKRPLSQEEARQALERALKEERS